MKRNPSVMVLFVLILSVSILAQVPYQTTLTPRPKKAETVEKELLELEQEWANATIKADFARLDRILADDWVLTDAEGVVWDKPQILALMKAGDDVTSGMTNEDMKARVYGESGVVTGGYTSEEKMKGKNVGGHFRFTDTWIYAYGRWQCVATHVSKIAGK